MNDYVAPQFALGGFTCPICGVYSLQYWVHANWDLSSGYGYNQAAVSRSRCVHCEKECLWVNQESRIYPLTGNSPPVNKDTPSEIMQLYNEASAVMAISPRAAAALLRLAVQHLCKHLGGAGKNINEDIKELVKNGLPARVQKALDVVRVTGNDAVHPGQIDTDSPEVVGTLFKLVNLIVEQMISTPKEVDDLFVGLPEDKRKAIEARDK